MELYLTGRNILITSDINGEPTGNVWEFIGVFNDKEKAINSCVKDNDFVTPITLNQYDNREKVRDWEEIEYPLYKEDNK